MTAIITEDFRKNNADAFVSDITSLATDSPQATSTTGYYIGIGKSDPWPDDQKPTTPNGSELERKDVIENLIAYKLIEPADISRLLPKSGQEWSSGRIYKRYNTTDTTCFNQRIEGGTQVEEYACYAIYNDYLYLCLGNNNGGASTVDPQAVVSVDGDVEQGADNYIWCRIGQIPIGNDFENSNTFFIMPTDLGGAVSSTIGLIYGFEIVDAGQGYAVDGNYTGSLRYTTLNGSTGSTAVTVVVSGGAVTSILNPASSPINSEFTLADLEAIGTGTINGIRSASIHFDDAVLGGLDSPLPSYTRRANIQPLITPSGGLAVDNLDVFPPYYIGLSADFVTDENSEVLIDTTFRQVSIIKNPSANINQDSPIELKVQDSLSYIERSGGDDLSTIGPNYDTGWYMMLQTSEEKAWIDYIDTTSSPNRIYYHQNSDPKVTSDVLPSTGTIDIYSSINQKQTTSGVSYNANVAPEHNKYTGEVIFLDNRIPILRTSTQTENVRIILQF